MQTLEIGKRLTLIQNKKPMQKIKFQYDLLYNQDLIIFELNSNILKTERNIIFYNNEQSLDNNIRIDLENNLIEIDLQALDEEITSIDIICLAQSTVSFDKKPKMTLNVNSSPILEINLDKLSQLNKDEILKVLKLVRINDNIWSLQQTADIFKNLKELCNTYNTNIIY